VGAPLLAIVAVLVALPGPARGQQPDAAPRGTLPAPDAAPQADTPPPAPRVDPMPAPTVPEPATPSPSAATPPSPTVPPARGTPPDGASGSAPGSDAGATVVPTPDADREPAADRRRRAAARAAEQRRRAAAHRRQSAALAATRARERAVEVPPPVLGAVAPVASAPTDGQLRLAALVLIVLALASLGLLVPMRRRWSL
jgi:hypothetical protein